MAAPRIKLVKKDMASCVSEVSGWKGVSTVS